MVVKRNTNYARQQSVPWGTLPVFFAAVFFLLLFKSCEKDEFIHPVIHTGEVTGITSEGARFHGRIIMHSDVEVLDHGFVWGRSPTPAIGNAYTMSMGEAVAADFTMDVHSNLRENRTYYVRAFARNESFTWYGREVSFFSLGSRAPVIYEVSPLSGTWGDTLTMKGRYFSYKGEENNVFLGTRCELTFSSDSLLKFIVPHELDTVKAHVKLVIAGNEVQHEEAFVLDPPVIHNYSPQEGTFGTKVTISGKNFHEHYTTVFLDDHEAELVECSDTLITFTVPTGVPGGNKELRVEVLTRMAVADDEFLNKSPAITSMYPTEGTWRDTISITGNHLVIDGFETAVAFDNHNAEIIHAEAEILKVLVPDDLNDKYSWVKITTNNQTDTYDQFYTLLPPEVHHFTPEEAWFGQMIDIQGKHFHPDRNRNQVYFGSVSAFISSSTANRLLVNVPMGLDQINSTITVRSGQQETYSEESFHLKEHVLDSLSWGYGSRMDWIRINGQGLTSNTDVLRVRLGETAATIQSAGLNFVRFRPQFGSPHGYNPVIVEVLGRPVESPEMFFLYEPFEAKSNIPYGGVSPPVKFNVNDRIYIGGSSWQHTVGSNNFWEYDPQTDTWNQRANLPVSARYDDLSFALNDLGYLLVEEQLFRYDPSADSWTEQSSFPGFAGKAMSVFTINGFAYVGCGWGINENDNAESSQELWRYDPQTDSWLQRADHPFEPHWGSNGVVNGTGFAIQGKGYMGLGSTTILWEYDPVLDQWEEKINLQNQMPNASRRGMSALVTDEHGTRVYLSGGRHSGGSGPYRDMHVYDVEKGTVHQLIWIPSLGTGQSGRASHFSIPYQGKGFIGGGVIWHGTRDDMYLFDPANLPPGYRESDTR